jgi:N-acetylglucosaminyldiphosphoundecaprenol N-acetyl-beta-D-mannosaminyltransferase
MEAAVRHADVILPDGVGVTVASRLFGERLNRISGPSLMLALCGEGRRWGLRHYFFGGRGDTATRLADRLCALYPGLDVAGACSPVVGGAEELLSVPVIDRINSAQPDVLWVGLGAPKQEIWMEKCRGLLASQVAFGVGAAFDFHAGNVPWAPEYIRAMGLEWAYRLMHEPKRLWRRNMDSPLFLWHAAARYCNRRFDLS